MKHPNLRPCVISPPFGNYFSHPEATRIRGSFTAERRPGLIKHTLKSFRKVRGGWINKIGLRNCGVENATVDYRSMYSIAAIKADDWALLYDGLSPKVGMIEVNLGCPNVGAVPAPSKAMFELYHMLFSVVSVKIANSVAGFEQAMQLIDECGVKVIHACNTIPTDQGGISGAQAKETAQAIVGQLRWHHDKLTIIGGGGIYSKDDIDMYKEAGADHFSLSTAFMCPLNAWRLISYAANKYGV